MDITTILALVPGTPGCSCEAPEGLPLSSPDHVLPIELREFYTRCGGLTLASESPYSVRILRPKEVLLANPVIVGGLFPEDISSTWYTLATDAQGNFITIDLHPARAGRCYDSFFDRHGIVGSCAIVARSFGELIERLWANRGEYWYWLREDFVSLGDAYD